MCSALRSRMPQNNTIPMPCPGSATGDGKTRQSDSISARRASAARRGRRREDTMTTSEISISRLSDAEHRVQLRRAVVASTVGTIIEAYDFLLYVQVAPLVFAKLYFPSSDPLVATLLLTGLSTFAVGFVPSYASIGIWGAVILTIVRFIQGMGIGGEWGGATP